MVKFHYPEIARGFAPGHVLPPNAVFIDMGLNRVDSQSGLEACKIACLAYLVHR